MNGFRRQDHVTLCVDALITDAEGRIILIQRATEPFKGAWVFPGGIVETGETVEQACAREVLEETGLRVQVERLIGVYSKPGRDPRGSFVSIAFHANIQGGTPAVTDESKAFRWLEQGQELPMGFDHASMLADFRRQVVS
jgi:8-oxo-dGTP diphosphatase